MLFPSYLRFATLVSDSDGTLIRGRTEVIQGDAAAAIDEFWEETFWRYDDPLYPDLLNARIDIGQWIRSLAAMAVSGDLHTPRSGVMANQLNYLRPSDDRIVLLPFDTDEAWRSPRIGIHGDATTTSQADPRIEKLLLYPSSRRRYYEEITGILDCEFAPQTIFPVIEDMCARTHRSPSRVEELKAFVEERTVHLEQVIENYIDRCEAFSPLVETNAGISFFTNQPEVRVTGTVIPGSAGVEAFRVEGEPSNLLANEGFEEGTGGWSIRGLRPYVSASIDEEVSHSGLASLKVTVDGGDPDYYGVVQLVDCLPLTKYRLTYFIRATEMQNGHMFVNVIDADNGENYLSVYVPERRQIGESPWLHSDCDWTCRSGIITTKEQTHRLAVRLCRVPMDLPLAGEAAGKIWYDDIRLEELGFGRQSLGAATYDANSSHWSKILPLDPGENVFEFVSRPIASRPYSANNGDTDGDSMPDGWEVRHDLDPTSSHDVSEDADGDGLTNLEEFLAGTDPSDPSSPFSILHLMKVGETLELTWFSVPGQTYRVLSSGDMDSWTVISDPIIADSAECSFVDDCRDRRVQFYRIELLR